MPGAVEKAAHICYDYYGVIPMRLSVHKPLRFEHGLRFFQLPIRNCAVLKRIINEGVGCGT